MLATSISGCSSATGALARRPILPSNSAWQSACPKKCIRCAGREEWRLSAQETFSRGGARKKTAGECKRCELARSYSSLCLVSPMAQEWRVVARGVHVCAVPLRSPIHTPLRWLHGRKRGNWQGARPKRRRPRSSCTAQLGQPVPQDSPSTKSSCSGGVGSASGGLFCARFALNHDKKAVFSPWALPLHPPSYAHALVFTPLKRDRRRVTPVGRSVRLTVCTRKKVRSSTNIPTTHVDGGVLKPSNIPHSLPHSPPLLRRMSAGGVLKLVSG